MDYNEQSTAWGFHVGKLSSIARRFPLSSPFQIQWNGIIYPVVNVMNFRELGLQLENFHLTSWQEQVYTHILGQLHSPFWGEIILGFFFGGGAYGRVDHKTNVSAVHSTIVRCWIGRWRSWRGGEIGRTWVCQRTGSLDQSEERNFWSRSKNGFLWNSCLCFGNPTILATSWNFYDVAIKFSNLLRCSN